MLNKQDASVNLFIPINIQINKHSVYSDIKDVWEIPTDYIMKSNLDISEYGKTWKIIYKTLENNKNNKYRNSFKIIGSNRLIEEIKKSISNIISLEYICKETLLPKRVKKSLKKNATLSYRLLEIILYVLTGFADNKCILANSNEYFEKNSKIEQQFIRNVSQYIKPKEDSIKDKDIQMIVFNSLLNQLCLQSSERFSNLYYDISCNYWKHTDCSHTSHSYDNDYEKLLPLKENDILHFHITFTSNLKSDIYYGTIDAEDIIGKELEESFTFDKSKTPSFKRTFDLMIKLKV